MDDGEEDLNGNGVIDSGETAPTRIDDDGDFDGDGLQNWEENNTCTLWNVSDSDGGGISDGDEEFPGQTDPCSSIFNLVFSILSWDAAADVLTINSTEGINPDPVDWRGNAPMAYFVSSIRICRATLVPERSRYRTTSRSNNDFVHQWLLVLGCFCECN